MDVITSFLNRNIEEEILMEVPDGFPEARDNTKICKINKALYGLKHSPKSWYDHISAWLGKRGLTRCEGDSNLFILKKDGKLTILLLYVDDLLITSDDQEEISKLKADLKQEFEMTNLGEASDYLGVEIH